MSKELNTYNAIGQAIALLLHPHAEVVVHDLKTGKIAAIFNSFSKRKVGDPSLLEELKGLSEIPDVFPPYFQMNWDGRRMKSVSATLRDEKGKAIGLLCINIDISKWEEMEKFISGWLEGVSGKERPAVLFKDDWRERINTYVFEFLKKEGVALKVLSKEKKKELVSALHKEGAFAAKNAAAYIADVLQISRATIYNYLKE
jgi:predicted transcriptional regulator YheO